MDPTQKVERGNCVRKHERYVTKQKYVGSIQKCGWLRRIGVLIGEEGWGQDGNPWRSS